MKTIALKEETFQILKNLKEKRKIDTYDKIIVELVVKEEKIPYSMKGFLKGKAKPFTHKEREGMWGKRI